MNFIRVLEATIPALASFGPLFLVMDPRRPDWGKRMQGAGALMVSAAFLIMWFIISVQKADISMLEMRVRQLESRAG
jgi:hypothetical protein